VEAFCGDAYSRVVPQTLESQAGELEKQVAGLIASPSGRIKNPWRTYGAFKDDPEFEQAARLGREFREQRSCDREFAVS
jgi:hypothetical protein